MVIMKSICVVRREREANDRDSEGECNNKDYGNTNDDQDADDPDDNDDYVHNYHRSLNDNYDVSLDDEKGNSSQRS